MSKKQAALDELGIVRKGSGQVAVPADRHPGESEAPSAAPAIREAESQADAPVLAPARLAEMPAPLPVPAASVPRQAPRGTMGTIAVTVRLDPVRYEQLKMLGVKTRRTNQDMLVEALDRLLAEFT